jgi:predicted nucleic acid-binding protein
MRSAQCRRFLIRCAQEEVLGITTVEVINEVCHRLMLAEAVATGAIAKTSAISLKRKPEIVRDLQQYWMRAVSIFDLNLVVIELDELRIRRAQKIRTQYGLLTNDSLIVAAAQTYGLDSLASRDDDFDRIPGLAVYKPTDLP